MTSSRKGAAGMPTAQEQGRLGEGLARLYLQTQGFRILDTGFRRPGGELDLVASRAEVIAFVEVKTRGARNRTPPEAWVTPLKLSRMRQAARFWIHEHPPQGPVWYRFDVVVIQLKGRDGGLSLRHLPDVR